MFGSWKSPATSNPVKGSPLSWIATIARNLALYECGLVRPLAHRSGRRAFDLTEEIADPCRACNDPKASRRFNF